MDKNHNDNSETPAFDAAAELVRGLLEDGVSVPDISFALAYVATDLGLQLAPTPAHAIAVVTDAIHKSAVTHSRASAEAASDTDAETSVEDAPSVDAEIFGRTVH